MDFKDKEVVELKEKKMKEEYCNFEKGFYIKHKIVEFERQVIFPDKMSIMLPKEFISMPAKMAKIKYPSEMRPQVIKTDLTGSINLGFNLFNQKITPKQIPRACETFRKIIRNTNPAIVFYDEGMETRGETMCSWFEYKSYAMDGQVYNMLYVTSIDGYLLHGLFNCLIKDMSEWQRVISAMRDSIIDLTEKE